MIIANRKVTFPTSCANKKNVYMRQHYSLNEQNKDKKRSIEKSWHVW